MTLANDVLSVIHAHTSVRHYSSRPVSDEQISVCIDAAIRAATSSNLQMWSAIVVRDRGRRQQLAELCGNQQHIREAPVFIAWCADRRRLDEVAKRRNYEQVTDHVESFLVAAIDTALAMQNALLAAESIGLGGCYIGGLRNDTEAVISLLELPRFVFPIAGLTLGYADKKTPTKPRLEREAFVHFERYRDTDSAVYARYDTTMKETGIYRDRQVNGVRRDGTTTATIPEDEYSWSEHSARRISLSIRTDLRAVLNKQGYTLQ